MKLRSRVTLLLCALAVLGIPASACAQAFPDKPIRVIIPYAPGGMSDYVVRVIQNNLGALLGQQIVVENRPGATGAIGAELVARSKPDGYTIMYTPGTDMVLRQFLMKANTLDTLKDFSAIIAPVQTTDVIGAHPSAPFNTAKEFIDYAKRNPGKLTYSTPGVGSNFHLAGELLKLQGIDLVHVPYKGGGPALAGVIANETVMALGNISTLLPAARDGRVKFIALIDSQRNKDLPTIPTMKETLPGFEVPGSWFAFFGPAAMPQAVVARLNTDIARVFTSPEVRPRIEDRSITIINSKPEEVTALVKVATNIYGRIIKAAGIQPE